METTEDTQTITSETVTQWFDEMLDDGWKPWTFGDSVFYPSQIIDACDPVMYRIMRSEFESQLEEDGFTIID